MPLPKFFISLITLLFFTSNGLTASKTVSEEKEGDLRQPRLAGVIAPETFDLSNIDRLRMLVGVELVDANLLDEADILFEVFGPNGKKLEIPVVGTLTARSVLIGNKMVGLDVAYAQKYRGENFAIKVCAFSNVLKGNPCSVVDLIDRGSPLDEHPKTAKETAEFLQKQFPGIGCRCKSGLVRHSSTDTNHGTLGSFTDKAGGPKYGPYFKTDVKADLISSNMKFEPHFEIEILNAPEKPKGYDAKKWSEVEKLFPSLCTEGQRINGTDNFHDPDTGKPISKPILGKFKGATIPFQYKVVTDDVDALTWDAHGYRTPGTGKGTVKGNVKSHEKNVVHWLDSAGFNQAPLSKIAKIAPTKSDYFFHTFVHGSTGKPTDNCDCFHGIRTAIVDGMGIAGKPQIISKPMCK